MEKKDYRKKIQFSTSHLEAENSFGIVLLLFFENISLKEIHLL
jgi:hypothetical protein